jgi:hypothetical protein
MDGCGLLGSIAVCATLSTGWIESLVGSDNRAAGPQASGRVLSEGECVISDVLLPMINRAELAKGWVRRLAVLVIVEPEGQLADEL